MKRRPKGPLEKVADRARPHLFLFLALAALFALSWSFLSTGWYTSRQSEFDWDFYWTIRELIRRFWMAGGDLFPWVPHICGGFPLLDSSEAPLLSPFLILWQILGAVPGTKWEFVLLQAIGLVGMYRVSLETAPKLPKWVAACGALQYVICGFFLLHLNAGHIGFAVFALFPWIAYGFLTQNGMWIAAALAAGPILGANNYFMHAILLTGFIGLTRWEWFKLMVQAGLWTAVLGAPVLFHNIYEYREASFLKFTAANHHELPKSVFDLFRYMTDPQTSLWVCDVDCYWEYGNYIGPVALIVAAVGLAIASKGSKRFRPWGIVGVIYLLIAMGPFASWAPFKLFLHFPLLNRLEINTRFLSSLMIPLMIGWFWFFERAFEKKNQTQRIAAYLAVVASIVPAAVYAHKMYSLPGRGRPLADLRGRALEIKTFRHGVDWRAERYDALVGEYGEPWCHVSSNKRDYPGKIQLEKGLIVSGPASSSARFDDRYLRLNWTPTAAEVSAGGSVTWTLNQNYSRYFEVRSLTSDQIRVDVSKNADQLLTLTIPEVRGIAAVPQGFVLRLKPVPGLVAAYALMAIGWVVFLSRWVLSGRARPRAPARSRR